MVPRICGNSLDMLGHSVRVIADGVQSHSTAGRVKLAERPFEPLHLINPGRGVYDFTG